MLSLGVGLTSVPVLARRGPAYDPDALAFFARLTTPPTEARKKLYSDLITSLKTAGVWAKLDALYIIAAADAQAARQNLVANAFNLTAVGSPAFTADRGYTGDGIGAYLPTGLNPATAPSAKYTLDQATLFSWVRTANVGSYASIGVAASPNLASIRPNSAGSLSVVTNNGAVDTLTVASSVGLSAWTRTGATALKLYKNAVPSVAKTTASVALPNNAFNLLNLGGALTQSSIDQIAFAGIGGALTDADHTALFNALDTYRVAIGA